MDRQTHLNTLDQIVKVLQEVMNDEEADTFLRLQAANQLLAVLREIPTTEAPTPFTPRVVQ